MFYDPEIWLHRVTDISPILLKEKGIAALILDIDNTLTTHNHPHPAEGVMEWLEQMKSHGIQGIILSNNSPQRVKPFADSLGLPFIANGKKPLSSGFKRAQAALGVDKRAIAVVGDQLFTDILGGIWYGCHTILLDPIELETMKFFKLKRRMEHFLLRKAKRKRG